MINKMTPFPLKHPRYCVNALPETSFSQQIQIFG